MRAAPRSEESGSRLVYTIQELRDVPGADQKHIVFPLTYGRFRPLLEYAWRGLFVPLGAADPALVHAGGCGNADCDSSASDYCDAPGCDCMPTNQCR
jgi:hypothetical protein